MRIKTIFATTILLCCASLVLSGCFKTRAEIEKERSEQEMQQTLHKNVYETTEGLEKTQTQIGRLQGRLEEAEHFRKSEVEEQRKTLAVMQERIAQLEQRAANSEKLETELVEEIKKMKTENLKMLSEASAPPAPAGKKKNAESGRLKAGLEAYHAKHFAEAAEHFQKIVDAGAKNKDFVKANFYLGQSHFAQKQYAEAIVAFSVVYEKDSKEPLWKKSTLKIAESFRKLGKKKDAKPFAQALVEKYPDSTEAQMAKKFIN